MLDDSERNHVTHVEVLPGATQKYNWWMLVQQELSSHRLSHLTPGDSQLLPHTVNVTNTPPLTRDHRGPRSGGQEVVITGPVQLAKHGGI